MATRRQARGHAVMAARERQRWTIVQNASADGSTRDEAAARAGLTPGGLNAMLYRRTGSKSWPLRQAHQEHA